MSDQIRWRVNLRSAPDHVFDALATDEARAKFWAEETDESDRTILPAAGIKGSWMCED